MMEVDDAHQAAAVPAASATTSRAETAPRIPLEVMIPIFRRLPTSELIRFVSCSVPVLRSYWSAGVKAVVERRLPFAVRLVKNAQPPFVHYVVVDATGATIAAIKHPELFRYSQICDLVEEAVIPLRLRVFMDKDAENWHTVVALFRPLRNLTSICLEFKENRHILRTFKHPLNSREFGEEFREINSQLDSFKLVETDLPDCDHTEMVSVIREMTSLTCLSINPYTFSLAIPDAVQPEPYMPGASKLLTPLPDASEVLSRLECLDLTAKVRFHQWLDYEHDDPTPDSLDFIRTRCTRLRELSLAIKRDTGAYFTVFRALPNLATLGLLVASHRSLEVDTDEEAVNSVSELRLGLNNESQACPWLIALLSKFPGVRSFGLQLVSSESVVDQLGLLRFICQNRVLPCLQRLRVLSENEVSLIEAAPALVQLIESLGLPRQLDLSQFCYFDFVEFDRLVEIYYAMQRNALELCNIRGAVDPGAWASFQNYLAVSNDGAGRAFNWLSHEREEHWRAVDGFSWAADRYYNFPFRFKICGVKIEGPAKGDKFVVNIYDAFEGVSVFDQ